jgi:osmoprotectant transport system permease protein
VSEAQVAADFVKAKFGVSVEVVQKSLWQRIAQRTAEHLYLVGVSLLAAILVAIPLGVVAARLHSLGQIIIAVVVMIYTIPSLALLVFMIPLLGIGAKPAIVALFLYSLLPIVHNTHAGLVGIPLSLRESAAVLGLSSWTRLRQIELPLASPSILAGIKISAVINVGTATLGAIIGAGGYGQPIITGLRLANTATILEGAIPAAVLALLVQGVFELIEMIFVPRGLRLKSEAR